MTGTEARALLTVLIAAFPRDAIEQETFDLYAAQLANLEAGAARTAVERIVESGRHFPTIAEIREVYFPIRKAELDHQANERGLPEPAGDGTLPPEAQAFLDRIQLRSIDAETADTAERVRRLPEAEAGKCDDCRAEGERVRFGTRLLCRRCALPRLRVRAQVQA